MSLNSEIARIKQDKLDIKNAIEEKGGVIISESLDTAAEEILNIPTGGDTTIDWEKHPSAYLAIKKLTSKEVEYVEDSWMAQSILEGNSSRSDNHFITEFYISPKAEELDVYSSYNFMSEAYYLTKIDGLRYLTKLYSIDGFCAIEPSWMGDWPSVGSLESIDQLPPNLTQINSRFMYNQPRFNSPIGLPENMQYIGSEFMYNCTNFNQPLVIPSNVYYIEYNFMVNCDNFVGPLTVETHTVPSDTNSTLTVQNPEAPAFTSGIPVNGAGAEAWLAAMPYKSDWEYRNLYDPTIQPGDYGKIVYLNSASNEVTVDIPDGSVWSSLCGTGSWPITIDGVEIQQDQVIGYKFGPRTQNALPDYFLSGAPYIRELEVFPETLEVIGNNFMQSNQAFNSPLTFPKNLTTIGDNFLAYSQFTSSITLPNSLTSLGSYFLASTPFDQPIKIPASMDYIPSYFLYGCTNFNQRVVIGEWIMNINSDFLSGCTSFNQPLTVPATVDWIGSGFLYNCINCLATITIEAEANHFSSDTRSFATNSASAPIYEIGFTLAGTHAKDLEARLPARTSSPYRWWADSDVKPGDWGRLVYNTGYGADQTLSFRTEAEFRALGDSTATDSKYFSGLPVSVQKQWVREFYPGKMCKEYPNYFLSFCNNLVKFGPFAEGTISIGDHFCDYCRSADFPVILPDTVVSIGESFLQGGSAFNSPVVFPKGLKHLGTYAFASTKKFNQPLTIPGSLGAVPEYFLYDAKAFNSPITIEEGITTIEGCFLYFAAWTSSSYTPVFNSEIKFPQSLTTIGRYFLSDQAKITKAFSLPNVTEIGSNFMRDCTGLTEFDGATLMPKLQAYEGARTSIQYDSYFLSGCTGLRKVVLPATFTLPGGRFLYDAQNLETLEIQAPSMQWATSDLYTLSMSSASAPAYVNGVTLTGAGAQQCRNTYGDRSSNGIYRKLKLG